jgi:ribose transport system ATP-binding protein
MIHQELNLSPYQTIAENISLGAEPRGRLGFLDDRARRTRATRALQRIGASLAVDTPVYRLGVEERQLVEIAKALAGNARLLILDEPTAALEARQVDRLVEVLLRFREHGGTALYVSHRLDEIARLCDHITILRDGRVAATVDAKTVTRDAVVELMIGRPLGDLFPPRATGSEAAPRLEARGLWGTGFEDLSFTIRAGRVLGFAGLEGSGMREVGRVLAGDRAPTAGEILIDGRPVRYRSPRRALRAGVIYVSADRRNDGLFGILSVRENISIGTLASRLRMGLVALRAERRVVNESIRKLGIQTPTSAQEVRRLSGGNQQKVVLARWLPAAPRVAIFDEPTRGIDVGAKSEIYRLMRDLTNADVAVLMISTDLTEIVGMADEIVALRGGQAVGTFDGGITEAKLLGAIL